MSLDWQNLRPWERSQQNAFEELCCQLAAYEELPQGSVFIRKAPPDAGVECYWNLPNGDERGWQAKFFRSPPNSSMWRQIDESVETALKKHPRLTSYTICLPIDRSDPRVDGKKSFMNKWSSRVSKWENLTKEMGMSVEFSYWGAHEILERLTREEHRGRILFWFNEELFSQQWFEDRLKEAIANVGPRYSPELNVELPIVRIFDCLGRTTEFRRRMKVLYGETIKADRMARTKQAEEVAKDELDSLEENLKRLMPIMDRIEGTEMMYIDWNSLAGVASECKRIASKCIQSLRTIARQKEKTSSSLSEREVRGHSVDFGYELHYLLEFRRTIDNLEGLARSNEVCLSNTPALLLVGGAGTGKTHLFCDVADRRIRSGAPTILLLGGQFTAEEPWTQILRLLGLSCTREEFLGALEAAAQSRGVRALIMIDALNEGEGKNLWNKHIAGMLTTLSGYPWIGIAFSVRTSYEDIVIPNGFRPEKLVRETHVGFAGHEYQGARTFFDFFDIEFPGMPLLVPEFQNPLFLRLLCQGVRNRGLTRVPSRLQGSTSIFKFLLESINDKLAKPDVLDFDSRSLVVQKAVEELAEMMADGGKTWLEREEAQVAVTALLPRMRYEDSLFRHLISEGLIFENRFRSADNEWQEGICFSYERFGDNMVAECLLRKHLDHANPSFSFEVDQPLGVMVADAIACWRNRSLVEAFSIQLPELIGKELPEVAPKCAEFQPIREAFVESLIWRDPEAITDSTLAYINEHIVKHRDIHDLFLDALLTVTSNPNHPYNADFLHERLGNHRLADRDAWWSIFLHYQYGGHRSVDRIVDWAWSSEDKGHISDSSIRLCGTALAWFLTTPNRCLRDRATKALVSILTDRIHVLRHIIREFLDVDDIYVLERLFAVAYGCAMRSTNINAIGELAKDVYELIFGKSGPPAHILLRDYARGVIEYAQHQGVELDIESKKVRPPYASDWPAEIPREKDLEKYGEWEEGMPDDENARLTIFSSVMRLGDFARYVVETTFGHSKWSSQPKGELPTKSRNELFEAFVKSLTGDQVEAWARYYTVRKNIALHRLLFETEDSKTLKRRTTEEDLERAIAITGKNLRGTLDTEQDTTFGEIVIPYLDEPYSHKEERYFDASTAQRLILKKVFDMGWTVRRFGKFDRDITRYPYYGRRGQKAERIGKKYQWIACHEFLARLSDNFEFMGDSSLDPPMQYDGPWQIGYVRDIDPSCLIRKTERCKPWEPHVKTWWFPSSYDARGFELDDTSWLKNSDDLPTIEPLIEVTNPEDGSKWLVLEAFYRWGQPIPPEEEHSEIPRRDIWYEVKSYITKKSDMDELFEWAQKQNFIGGWMPESHELTQVFLGEFFWAPAYEYHNTPYYHHHGWTRGNDNRIPREVLVSSDEYMREHNDHDCSLDKTVRIHLPAKWLADNMGIKWNAVEGCYYDNDGELVVFDPSVRTRGPGCLLANRDVFLKFLNENGYDILWTIKGEKNIIGGRMSKGEWKGRLEINGAYRISGEEVTGTMTPKYTSKS